MRLTSLFLGAGATYEMGMPLVKELTDELRRKMPPEKWRKFNANWRAAGGGFPDEVIEDFIAAMVRPDMHYEAALGHVETQMRRAAPSAFFQEYAGLYAQIVEILYILLYDHHVRNLGLVARLPWLDGIAKLAEQSEPLWVFELNHDLVIEMLAARHHIPVSCGFSSRRVRFPRRDASGKKIGELIGEHLSGSELERGALFPAPGAKGINVLKIHGSLDTFACGENGEDLVRVLPTNDTPEGVLDALVATNTQLIHPEMVAAGMRTTNEISYADDAGQMQFLRRALVSGAFKFDPRRSQVLPRHVIEVFRGHLNGVGHLISVGYGFGDLHINAIVRDWLEWDRDRRLTIVGPGVTAIPAPFLHVAPQVELRDSTANDYFDEVGNIQRTTAEKLARKLAQWSRHLPKSAVDAIVRPAVESLGREDVALADVPTAVERVLENMRRQLIAREAHRRYESRGRVDGHDVEDWLAAEKDLKLHL